MDAMKEKPLWQLDKVTKVFPGVIANDAVSVSLYPGQIHGLLGENGSGKSTLIKLMSGVYKPDGGSIRYRGEEVHLENPIKARQKGVATVFQEFSLIPTMTVAENIFMGRPLLRAGGALLDWKVMRRRTLEVFETLKIDISPEAEVGSLSISEQQLVEIAKAVQTDATMLILDEPTTALGEYEITVLHSLLRRLKKHDVAILYISHRLDEVMALVDRITILKDGKVVSSASETKMDITSIIEQMVGREIKQHYPKQYNAFDEELLKVQGLSSTGGANDVSFTLKKGEVFGLGGVVGSGRTEIVRALFGIDRITSGNIRVNGKKIVLRSCRDAIKAGIGFIPENRKTDGLFFNFQGAPNVSSASLSHLCRAARLLNLKEESNLWQGFVSRMQIPSTAMDKLVTYYSGGNQQKVVIARWLCAKSKILILDEPTQGIDVGAKIAIYELMNQLTADGFGVILISSDHDELIAMSDRIGIIHYGKIVDIRDAKEVTHAHLVQKTVH